MSKQGNIWGIIVAGGRGERFKTAALEGKRPAVNADLPKQFHLLHGKPIYIHCIERLSILPEIETMVVVAPPEFVAQVATQVFKARLTKVKIVVAGGKLRQDSVWEGLKQVPSTTRFVLVQDAVRPFPPLEQSKAAIRLAFSKGAAILAIPATDTVKLARSVFVPQQPCSLIKNTLSRDSIWLAQTPQIVRYDWLLNAYKLIREKQLKITDEAQAVELLGKPVYLVPGSITNIKITTPADILMAEFFLRKRLV
ncbi:MAG: 2-C-methyl-D-erythritol 4-phosphate cytidylyltransferase [Candidatus Sumerlaeia bacterium]|nr:2-C-methyl-D-erythritol 4-phosphate cytidylyltransferase [Candidatus Sumerlaeia bacterium]